MQYQNKNCEGCKTLEGDKLSFPVNWDQVITALFEITVIKKMLIIIPVNLALNY